MKIFNKKKLIFLFSCSLFIACSTSEKMYHNSRLYWRDVYRVELEPIIKRNRNLDKITNLEITFQKLLAISCKYDSQISLYSLYWKKNLVDKEQSSKLILPKINLELSASMPLDKKETDANNIFSGGFYLKYNILEALFYADSMSINEAMAKKRNIQIIQQIKNIILKSYNLILELKTYQENLKTYKEIYALSKQVLYIEENLKTSTIDSILSYRAHLKEIKNLQNETSFFLSKSKRSILKMTGHNTNTTINIINLAETIDKIREKNINNINIKNHLQKVWMKNNYVKLAKIDLFITEIKLAKAKRSWYPQISASIATGKLSYGSDNQSSNIIVSSTISMPIIDWGYANRIELLAKYDRDIMRIKLIEIARNIINNLDEAERKVKFSQIKYNYSKEKLDNAKNYYIIKKSLLKTSKVTPKNLLLAKISFLKTKINHNKIVLKLLKKYINWNYFSEQLINKNDLMLIYKQCFLNKHSRNNKYELPDVKE